MGRISYLKKTTKMLSRLANFAIGAGVFLTVVAPSTGLFYVVNPGERAIILNKIALPGMKTGVQEYLLKEGIHIRIPGIQDRIIYEIRLKPYEYPTSTSTKDLQSVKLHLRILYKPVEEVIPRIHLTYDKDFANRLLPSIGNEVLKSVIAHYDADQLLKNREKIANEIKEGMVTRARENIIIDDVSLIDLKFSTDYMRSIEQKQSAQQEAERYKYVVQQDEELKRAEIIKAEGKAEAAQLISDSIQKYGASVIELKKIEASESIAKNLTQSSNISFVPPNINMLLSGGI